MKMLQAATITPEQFEQLARAPRRGAAAAAANQARAPRKDGPRGVRLEGKRKEPKPSGQDALQAAMVRAPKPSRNWVQRLEQGKLLLLGVVGMPDLAKGGDGKKAVDFIGWVQQNYIDGAPPELASKRRELNRQAEQIAEALVPPPPPRASCRRTNEGVHRGGGPMNGSFFRTEVHEQQEFKNGKLVKTTMSRIETGNGGGTTAHIRPAPRRPYRF